MTEITAFHGSYFFLSNFYPCRPKSIYLPADLNDPRYWLTTEHAFQAAKTLDIAERDKIHAANSPAQAKRLGRKVTLRTDWEAVKSNVMLHLLQAKFSDPFLRAKLLTTFPAVLVEGNTWHDNTWGNCFCATCKDIPGQNLLGKLLTTVRLSFNEAEL